MRQPLVRDRRGYPPDDWRLAVRKTEPTVPRRFYSPCRTSMKHVQYLLVFYAILGHAADSRSLADETPSTIDQLKRENEELNSKIKALREEEEARFKKLEQELDQRIRIVDRKRELDIEASETKAQESSPIFKLPEWITGIR